MDEIIAGGLAGVSQTIVGYPLDTIKVCLANKSPIIWKQLYRGCMSPMFGGVLVNAQTFYSYNWFHSQGFNVFNSGFLCGLGISIIETPVELLKIRMQTSAEIGLQKSYLETVKELGPRRIFHGAAPTFWRNGIALGIYFDSYERVKNVMVSYPTWATSLVGGTVAGVLCWVVPYPIDCIKTQIQADTTYKRTMRSYLYDPALRVGLWRGFGPCILRSAITNPFIFLTYEWVLSSMQD